MILRQIEMIIVWCRIIFYITENGKYFYSNIGHPARNNAFRYTHAPTPYVYAALYVVLCAFNPAIELVIWWVW